MGRRRVRMVGLGLIRVPADRAHPSARFPQAEHPTTGKSLKDI